jgi:hypothetical protein
VTSESSSTTACNGQQHFDMLPADPSAATFDEAVSRSADQIGNFETGRFIYSSSGRQLADGPLGSRCDPHLYLKQETTTDPFGAREAFAAAWLRSNGVMVTELRLSQATDILPRCSVLTL